VIVADHVGDRAHLDAWLIHADEEERDAPVLRLFGGGARQHEDHVGGLAL